MTNRLTALLTERFGDRSPVLVDGGMGTLLQDRGLDDGGAGIGDRLLDAMTAWAGCKALDALVVWPSDESVANYERVGFSGGEVLQLPVTR